MAAFVTLSTADYDLRVRVAPHRVVLIHEAPDRKSCYVLSEPQAEMGLNIVDSMSELMDKFPRFLGGFRRKGDVFCLVNPERIDAYTWEGEGLTSFQFGDVIISLRLDVETVDALLQGAVQ